MISWEQFVMLTAECSRAQIADALEESEAKIREVVDLLQKD